MKTRPMKAITFSYDDGVKQDKRLIDIFDKYGLKATFNLNSGLLGREYNLVREGKTVGHNHFAANEIAQVYQNHEVAAHTIDHPSLIECNEEQIIFQVEKDREVLSELVGYEVVGMAYPGGGVNFNDRVAEIISKYTGIKYARTTTSAYNFEKQRDLYVFKPTVYHHVEFDKMEEMAREFIDMKTDRPQIFYIWGHSYEFDIHNTWDRFEKFCEFVSRREDIFYGTNKEILL